MYSVIFPGQLRSRDIKCCNVDYFLYVKLVLASLMHLTKHDKGLFSGG